MADSFLKRPNMDVEYSRLPSTLSKIHTFYSPFPTRALSGARSEDILAAVSERQPSPQIYTDQGTLSIDSTIKGWEWEDIKEWLSMEVHLSDTESIVRIFNEQNINRGSVLLRLEEGHLKEIGVVKVGDRLLLLEALDDLRKRAGLVPSVSHVEVDMLVDQLDMVRAKRHLAAYPKRIILIRHGESQGNVDSAIYAHVPDCKLELTPRGVQQAREGGKLLQELVGGETVSFYVSPFVRSRQTYKYLREAFHDEQVLYYREDPRIREQEWGNFQDPSKMEKVMDERRRIGAFFYRFATGESGADVFDRVSTFLETLYRDMQKGLCGENAIIVTHGLFCRLFLTRFYHWPVEKFHQLWNFQNCQHAIMEQQPEGYYKLITELKSD